ncbi:uncharacterized protein LOC113389711 [Ctenocephalides felis]|uniref:uncharacterized protein LOC113389711 n=1 Tax=Ctenocephalides felis TaxID=7515 RepID=UPI000E6E5854|nr:uncharacterized protein LOC113389711 [Ctenocephalides felis]
MTLLALQTEETAFDKYLKEMTRTSPFSRRDASYLEPQPVVGSRHGGADALLAAVEPVLIDLQAPVSMPPLAIVSPPLREIYCRRRTKRRKPKYEDKEVQYAKPRPKQDNSSEDSSSLPIHDRYELETILPPRHVRLDTIRSASRRDVTTGTSLQGCSGLSTGAGSAAGIPLAPGAVSPPIWDEDKHSEYVAEKVSKSFEAVNALFDRNNKTARPYAVTKKFENFDEAAAGDEVEKAQGDDNREPGDLDPASQKQALISPLRTAAELMKFLTKRIIAPETEIKFESALKESSNVPVTNKNDQETSPSPPRPSRLPPKFSSERWRTNSNSVAPSPRRRNHSNTTNLSLTSHNQLSTRKVAENHLQVVGNSAPKLPVQRTKQYLINEQGMREVIPRTVANSRSFFGGLKKKFLSVVNIEDSVVRIPEDFNLKQERPMVVSIDTDRNLRKDTTHGKQMQVQALPAVDIRNTLVIQCMPNLSIPPTELPAQGLSNFDADGKSVSAGMDNVGLVMFTHQDSAVKCKESKSDVDGRLVMDDANRGFVKVRHSMPHQKEFSHQTESAVLRKNSQQTPKQVEAVTQTSQTPSDKSQNLSPDVSTSSSRRRKPDLPSDLPKSKTRSRILPDLSDSQSPRRNLSKVLPPGSNIESPIPSPLRATTDISSEISSQDSKRQQFRNRRRHEKLAESEPELGSFKGFSRGRRICGGADKIKDYYDHNSKLQRSPRIPSRRVQRGMSFVDKNSLDRACDLTGKVALDPDEFDVSVKPTKGLLKRHRRGGGIADLVRGLDAYTKGVAGKLAWYEQYDQKYLLSTKSDNEEVYFNEEVFTKEACTSPDAPQIKQFGGNVPSTHQLKTQMDDKAVSAAEIPQNTGFDATTMPIITERIGQCISSEIDQIDDNLQALQKRCASYRSKAALRHRPSLSTFTTIEDKTPKSPINSVEPPPISPPISVKRKPVASNTIQEESSGVHVHEFRLLSEIRREVYAGGADKDDKKISKDDGKKKKDTEGKKSQHRRRNCDGTFSCTRDIIIPYGGLCAEECSIGSSDEMLNFELNTKSRSKPEVNDKPPSRGASRRQSEASAKSPSCRTPSCKSPSCKSPSVLEDQEGTSCPSSPSVRCYMDDKKISMARKSNYSLASPDRGLRKSTLSVTATPRDRCRVSDILEGSLDSSIRDRVVEVVRDPSPANSGLNRITECSENETTTTNRSGDSM